MVAGANVHDMCLVGETLLMLDGLPVKRPNPKNQAQGLCLDKGYDYPLVREVAEAFSFEPHIRARGEEAHSKRTTRRYRARRWVVERTHSWLNRFRSAQIRWAKTEDNFVALLHLAFALIIGNAIGLFG